jgi:hypothetical protein
MNWKSRIERGRAEEVLEKGQGLHRAVEPMMMMMMSNENIISKATSVTSVLYKSAQLSRKYHILQGLGTTVGTVFFSKLLVFVT